MVWIRLATKGQKSKQGLHNKALVHNKSMNYVNADRSREYSAKQPASQEPKQRAICCVCGREGFMDERDESGWKVFADPRICEECVEKAAEEVLA